MAAGKQSRGQCTFCGHETAKGSMGKHLATCAERQALIARLEATTNRKPELLYRLRVQDAYSKEFWLDIEMQGSSKLQTLDYYLRAIWLECCGHLSEFMLKRWGETVDDSLPVKTIFKNIEELTHIYDFGTSSETLIKLMETRTGVHLSRNPIVLLARNVLPPANCMVCNKVATHFCENCADEAQASGFLCPEHAQNHHHEDQDFDTTFPLVNSPRVGMCGYDGPAEPPY